MLIKFPGYDVKKEVKEALEKFGSKKISRHELNNN